MLVACLAICFYVAYSFKHSSFRFLWPIKVLRLCVGVFFTTFYVSAFNMFLSMLDCVNYSAGAPQSSAFVFKM